MAYAAEEPILAPQRTVSESSFIGATNLDSDKSGRISLVSPVVTPVKNENAETSKLVTVKGETVYATEDLPDFRGPVEMPDKLE